MGGVLGLLMGSKRGRSMGGTALKYGGVAALGALAWKAYQDHQARQAGAASVQDELAKPGAAAAPAAQGYRLSQAQHYATQARTVNGRAFYQNSGVWQDSTAQEKTGLAAVNITFNSEAWFELMRKHPEARPWLSLGSDIDLVLDNQLYQIRG